MHEHVVMIHAGIYCSFYMHIVGERSRTLIAGESHGIEFYPHTNIEGIGYARLVSYLTFL